MEIIEEEMLNNFKKEMDIEKEECEDCGCDECNCDECDCGCDCEDCNCDECDCECCCWDDCCCSDYDDYDDYYGGTILDFCEEDFSEEIKSRGEAYYEDEKVGKIIKSNDVYITKVYGNDVYNVEIAYDGFDVSYRCTCPCEYPCKHLYATLLKINDGDYQSVELKEDTEQITLSAKELLEKVPAEELKSYILSDRSNDAIEFCLLKLNQEFEKYLPVQTYEYYYNNLYNSFILEDPVLIYKYIQIIKNYIAKEKYEESFKVIKAMIEANYATLKYAPSSLIDYFPNLTMFLRVTLRKSSDTKKEEILAWVKELEEKNFYNDVYLEDFILSVYK